jgi:hypothetical protein
MIASHIRQFSVAYPYSTDCRMKVDEGDARRVALTPALAAARIFGAPLSAVWENPVYVTTRMPHEALDDELASRVRSSLIKTRQVGGLAEVALPEVTERTRLDRGRAWVDQLWLSRFFPLLLHSGPATLTQALWGITGQVDTHGSTRSTPNSAHK